MLNEMRRTEIKNEKKNLTHKFLVAAPTLFFLMLHIHVDRRKVNAGRRD